MSRIVVRREKSCIFSLCDSRPAAELVLKLIRHRLTHKKLTTPINSGDEKLWSVNDKSTRAMPFSKMSGSDYLKVLAAINAELAKPSSSKKSK